MTNTWALEVYRAERETWVQVESRQRQLDGSEVVVPIDEAKARAVVLALIQEGALDPEHEGRPGPGGWRVVRLT